jgi:hypothetical protein
MFSNWSIELLLVTLVQLIQWARSGEYRGNTANVSK